MEDENMQTPFTKAFMTALFVGIIISVVCLIYNSIYRDETGLEPTDIINVGSIIFGVHIIFLMLGILFYLMRLLKGTGEIIYIAGIALLTAFLAWKAEGVVRSSNPEITAAFRGLLLGIVLIIGAGASLVVPFLFHNKKFEQNVL
ncbi:MAG: hypothetical protein KF746_20350 [Chitinophagaceae bacterium]|nr:hypothetical protein [Chitinophagaceae bacterium]